ncbi:MAG TPA: formyltransferase family protein, partial [bacterium]|nr:formyltransferase family protein [bacterium]
GPIILQAVVPVHDADTVETLAARIAQEEHTLYPQAVQLFAEGRLQIVGRRVRILPEGTRREAVGVTEISEGEGHLG